MFWLFTIDSASLTCPTKTLNVPKKIIQICVIILLFFRSSITTSFDRHNVGVQQRQNFQVGLEKRKNQVCCEPCPTKCINTYRIVFEISNRIQLTNNNYFTIGLLQSVCSELKRYLFVPRRVLTFYIVTFNNTSEVVDAVTI